jgi:hypothetical protein
LQPVTSEMGEQSCWIAVPFGLVLQKAEAKPDLLPLFTTSLPFSITITLHMASFSAHFSPQSRDLLLIAGILPPSMVIVSPDSSLISIHESVSDFPRKWAQLRTRSREDDSLDPVREACADWIPPRDVSLQQAEMGDEGDHHLHTHKAAFSFHSRPEIHRVTCVW